MIPSAIKKQHTQVALTELAARLAGVRPGRFKGGSETNEFLPKLGFDVSPKR